ncbi:hypothetical protein FA15DRAFT_617667 [Coprinopsis marcescibilis]|uniref:G-protein coupled receptors family 2 profile 2 domain-containing protein n=1 Tax=Coprinopsis marcescibilis TaxID=230819 RepID=A0A5C3KYR9_COPMA|nr:hypothetical protein FA15DRAFT_617667 [Coprinopsis marcescibilis]
MANITISKFQELGFSVSFASSTDITAVSILVAASFLSFISVLALLFIIGTSAVKAYSSSDRSLFVKSHVAAYFVCLMFCWVIQGMSSAMSIQWLQNKAVSFGVLCTTQGVFKHIADVGAAVWITIISVHIFCVLFLDIIMSKLVMWIVLALGWVFISLVVAIGPIIGGRGPFYGVSGLGCGATPEHELAGLLLGEMIMLLAAVTSIVLCLLAFLRVRGIIGEATTSPKSAQDVQSNLVVRQMLAYPASIVYACLAIPIVVVQYVAYSGAEIPLEWTTLCGCIYQMAGLVNVIIFTTTRRIMPSAPRDGDFNYVPRAQDMKPSQDQAERGISKTVTFAAEPTILCTPPGRRDTKRPPQLDLAFRTSFDSMYSMREGQYLAPLSSHWSPDTPPLFKKSRLSNYLQHATTIAQRI